MFTLGRRFIEHVVPGVVKPLRVLWNEIIGFIFISLGIVGAGNVVRFYGDVEQGGRMFISGAFAIVMLYFGVTSFWRARKIGKT